MPDSSRKSQAGPVQPTDDVTRCGAQVTSMTQQHKIAHVQDVREHEGAHSGEGPSRRTLSTIYPSDQHTLRTPYVVNIPTVRPDTLQQTVEYARTTREDSTSGALMLPEVWNQGRFDSEKMETVSNGTVVDDVKREHGKLIGIICDYVDDVMADNDDNDNDTLRGVPHLSNEGLALQARV